MCFDLELTWSHLEKFKMSSIKKDKVIIFGPAQWSKKVINTSKFAKKESEVTLGIASKRPLLAVWIEEHSLFPVHIPAPAQKYRELDRTKTHTSASERKRTQSYAA